MIVGFLGYGTISKLICRELAKELDSDIRLWGYLDPYLSESSAETESLERAQDIAALLASPSDLIVEAADQNAVATHVPVIIRSGKDVLSLSVGAYLDHTLYETIEAACREEGSGRLYLPSGALPAIDMIKTAALRRLDHVELITRKPFEALRGNPEVDRMLENSGSKRTLTLFHGNAREAVQRFPKNVNVSATLSLAGIGPDRTRVTIIADPEVDRNIHTVNVRGEFGELSLEIKANPSDNPKTSLTAPLSAVALIRSFSQCIRIGT